MNKILLSAIGIVFLSIAGGDSAFAQPRVFTNKDLRHNSGPGGSQTTSILEMKASPVSIDFKDAEVYQVLQVIADVARGTDGIELVVSTEITGKLSLTLANTPWTTVIKTIMQQHNLAAAPVDKKTLLIYPKK